MKLHKLARASVAVGILAVVFAQVLPRAHASAEDNKKLADAVKESSMANDFFKFLKPFRRIRSQRAHVVKWWSSADASPVESKGTGKVEWIQENRVISQTIKGVWLGVSYSATVLFGYDNTLGRYTVTWSDTLSNRMLFFIGQPNESGNVVTFTAKTGDALSRQPVQIRCVMQVPDRKGELKAEFFRTDTGGSEYKFMEIVSMKRIIRAG